MNDSITISDAIHDIHPRRLVMLSLGNNCMFCKDPKGESYTTYVALVEKLGYISCSDCRDKMRTVADFWRTHRAYGQANHLKDRTDLKIKRSNGDIDSGWRLNNPFVHKEYDGTITIHCYNATQNISKWCPMESILELNE